MLTPRSTSQHTTQLFLQVHLQGAIDFAVLRKRRWSNRANGGAGEYTDGRIISSPNFFSANFPATAICKLQLILRGCGCGVVGLERMAGLGLYVRTPAWHPAAHRANF